MLFKYIPKNNWVYNGLDIEQKIDLDLWCNRVSVCARNNVGDSIVKLSALFFNIIILAMFKVILYINL